MTTRSASSQTPQLRFLKAYPGLRVLAWQEDVLYACRGYQVVCLRSGASAWDEGARFSPVWWRGASARTRLAYRLFRDGFHALAVLADGTMIGAVPGAIVTCWKGQQEFAVTHRVARGTRPLHITATPSGRIYWGEYFDNRKRAEVYIYASDDRGATWNIAHTFPAGSIRHVHKIGYDRWGDCLWILTGDEGRECKILRASTDLATMDTVLEGNQQARAVAAVPTADAIYIATDTPYETNHVYRLGRSGHLECVGDLNSSSMYGCRVGDALFFSTMVEPSAVNTDREVHIAGALQGSHWQVLQRWKKDAFSMRYFQYGNAILPDGETTSSILAATTIAVAGDDLTTTLWQVL